MPPLGAVGLFARPDAEFDRRALLPFLTSGRGHDWLGSGAVKS